jgi:N-hydroxyarylamine O-acetyltransferase
VSQDLLSDRSAFDLDAYLARIGYAGSREASLEVLETLHRRHPEAIPFENLNPLAGWPVHLDTRSLQQKLVGAGRGGYCFEHNLLFAHALDALGFRVSGLAARVVYLAPPGALTARGHMLLRIELDDGPRVADVGFGGVTLTAPLRLVPGVEQQTPHERFRLTAAGNELVMEAEVRKSWTPLYRFDLQRQFLPDYEVTNWYLSHWPGSTFVTGLMAARVTADRRYALRDNLLTVHHVEGSSDTRILANVHELREALAREFAIRLPDAPDLDAALDRIVTARTDASHMAVTAESQV